jgi:hypothetical protein
MVLLLVLAGCSGAGGGADAGGGGQSADLAEDADGASAGGDGGDGGERAAGVDAGTSSEFSAQAASRAIILTGEVRVEVESFENASTRLRELARQQGGFVASSEQTVHGSGNESWTSGRLVVRVPSENFSALYDASQGLGTLEEATSDSEDVTEQLVDLNARIENLKAQRDRLRTLYERANETEAVLEVSRELSDVQGEIERLEAQRRSLEEQVALSTLTVRMHEPRPEPRIAEQVPFHETGLVTAFLSSVNGVVVAIQTVAVAVAYAIPYLVVFALPVVGLAVFLYRRR